MAEVIHHVAGLALHAPSDPERLRDPCDRPPGERRLPYWARLWPGGVVLARLVAGELAARVRGREVIELGCGLAAPGLAAARAGAAGVTLTDGDDDALAAAAENARMNGVSVRIERVEWARVPEALAGRFAVVLAAEVLYEREQVAPFSGALAALLAADGEAWLVDGDRLGGGFLGEGLHAAGLSVVAERAVPHPPDVPPVDGGSPRPLRVLCLRHGATSPTMRR